MPSAPFDGWATVRKGFFRKIMAQYKASNRLGVMDGDCKVMRNCLVFALLLLGATLYQAHARTSISDPATLEQSDTMVLVQLDSAESQVRQAVQEVAGDQIIHGTYSYEKERTLYGAHSADSSSIFGIWQNPGKAFYKVAVNVLAPRFFKDSGDVGTISVRYVVEAVGPNSTSLRIDATYFDARHVRHKSTGNVESKEYEAIQEHLRSLQARQKEESEEEKRVAEKRADARRIEQLQPQESRVAVGTMPAADFDSSQQSLEQRVDSLRRETEVQVRSSGAVLKSAPYKTAATIQSLPASTVVVVMVLTPYWYGVETEDGHKGWIHKNEVEPLP